MNNEQFRQQTGPVAGPENKLADLSEFTVTATAKYPACTFTGGETDTSKHVYTVDATYGKFEFEVKVSPLTGYGWFEHSTRGGGGGLWFNEGALYDFDGVACLPRDVALGLRAAGFIVEPEFD